MFNIARYVKMATSLLLFLTLSGYQLSIVSGDTAPNKNSCPFSLIISASSGHDMYVVYCAGCHGEDGRAKGRSSRYCTVPPADLTKLARQNHDAYPSERVCQTLRYGTGRPPKGQGYMPVWGPLLRPMNADPPGVTEVRIQSLSEYVRTLQDIEGAQDRRPLPAR